MSLQSKKNQHSRRKLFLCLVLFLIFITIISTLYYMRMDILSSTGILDISIATTRTDGQNKRCLVLAQERLGRLGNRMFLVAAAYGLARLHSCHLYVTPEILQELKEIFSFNLSASLLISHTEFQSLTNTNSTFPNTTSKSAGCEYFPELTRPNAIPPGMIFDLRGYWQSYLHFAYYGDELRENVFVATQPVLMKVSTFYGSIYQKQFGGIPRFSLQDHHSFKSQLAQSNLLTSIGIHVRRSDFASINYSSSDEYLFSAMKYYTSLYSNAYFLVATDDKPYCQKLFHNQPNVSITPDSFSPGDDLIALSFCQHSIVTGGTFGWWAAYLAHGRVMHDVVYPSGCERREYYYPPWFLIDGNVRAHINSSPVL